jgi:hypothetical protein
MVRNLLLAFVGLGVAAMVAFNLPTIALSSPMHSVTDM